MKEAQQTNENLPVIEVVRVILIIDDSILIGTRADNPDKGKLELPGGIYEKNDINTSSAILREVYEEAGSICDTLSLIHSHDRERISMGKKWKTYLFVGELDAPPPLSGPETINYYLIDVDGFQNIPKHSFAFDHWDMIDEYFQFVGN